MANGLHVAGNNWPHKMNTISIIWRGLLPIHNTPSIKGHASANLYTKLNHLLFFKLSLYIILLYLLCETMAASNSEFCGKLETDVEIKASPQQFHDMFSNKPHHVHHATYDNIQGCELHEGDWGKVGSVVFWNYVHGKPTNNLPC